MNLNDELINSAQNGDLAKLKKCLTKGANINASDENGETAILQKYGATTTMKRRKIKFERTNDEKMVCGGL